MSIRKRRAVTNRLRVLRAERRLSQSELATKARMQQSRVSGIENGHIEPSPTEQMRLARGLRVTVIEAFPPLADQQEAGAA